MFKNIDKYEKYFNSIIILILIFIGIYIRTKLLLTNYSFNHDECSLGANIYHSYKDFFHPLKYTQFAPPLFMVTSKFILNLFSGINNSMEIQDIILRGFPFICGVLSLPLFALLLNKISDNKYFNWVCICFLSCNLSAISYSCIFKQYSCEMLISLLLIYIFCSINMENISKLRLLIISLIFLIAPWYSHTSLIIIFTGLIYLLCLSIKNHQKHYKKFIILISSAIISLLLFYFLYYKNIRTSEIYEIAVSFWKDFSPAFFSVTNFHWLFYDKMLEILDVAVSQKFLYAFLLVNVIILIGTKKFKLIYFTLFPIIICIILSFMDILPFKSRLILFIMPCITMLVCSYTFIIKKNILSVPVVLLIMCIIINNAYTQRFDNYIIDKSLCRESVKILKQYNPGFENTLSHPSIFEYYSRGKRSLVNDLMTISVQESQILKFLSKTDKGDYWICVPLEYTQDYNNALKEYLYENNDNIKLLEIYEIPHSMNFVAHIRKL